MTLLGKILHSWWEQAQSSIHEKVLRYTKTNNFLVKHLKVVAKCCLNWVFVFLGALNCCLRYSNIEYWDEIFKIISSKEMTKSGFGHRFHDLKYFKVGFIFILLEFLISLRATLQKFVGKHQFDVLLSCLEPILNNYVFNTCTWTLLALSSLGGVTPSFNKAYTCAQDLFIRELFTLQKIL